MAIFNFIIKLKSFFRNNKNKNNNIYSNNFIVNNNCILDNEGKVESFGEKDTSLKKNGLWTYLYKDGSVYKKVLFHDNEKLPEEKTFYPNGNKLSYTTEEGKHSKQIVTNIYYLTGELYEKITKKTKAEDTLVSKTRYFKNGKIKETFYLKNDLLEGKYIKYNEDNFKIEECFYKNGDRNGFAIKYHLSGTKKSIDFYKDNCKEGTSKKFSETERLLQSILYKEGIQILKLEDYTNE